MSEERPKEGTTLICLACGYKWKTRWREKVDEKSQCVKCWGYSIVTEGQYQADLKHLRKMASPADVKKFMEIYEYLAKRHYVRNAKNRETKFRKLMGDLLDSHKPKPSQR